MGACHLCVDVEMDKCIDYVIVYAAQTVSDGIHYCRHPHAKLHASSDSDCHGSHSTSAYVIMFGAVLVDIVAWKAARPRLMSCQLNSTRGGVRCGHGEAW